MAADITVFRLLCDQWGVGAATRLCGETQRHQQLKGAAARNAPQLISV